MEATPPFQVVTGQRQLAAIMFTDAVGYSAQMHDQELATLNRLERDTGLMRRIASDRGGTRVIAIMTSTKVNPARVTG